MKFLINIIATEATIKSPLLSKISVTIFINIIATKATTTEVTFFFQNVYRSKESKKLWWWTFVLEGWKSDSFLSVQEVRMPFLGIQKILCLHVFFYLKYFCCIVTNLPDPWPCFPMWLGTRQGQCGRHNGFYGTWTAERDHYSGGKLIKSNVILCIWLRC